MTLARHRGRARGGGGHFRGVPRALFRWGHRLQGFRATPQTLLMLPPPPPRRRWGVEPQRTTPAMAAIRPPSRPWDHTAAVVHLLGLVTGAWAHSSGPMPRPGGALLLLVHFSPQCSPPHTAPAQGNCFPFAVLWPGSRHPGTGGCKSGSVYSWEG